MFELGILGVIVLAVGYWAALWWMGRHDDVLHGDFVQTDARPEVPISQLPGAQAGRADTLQALLTTIKRDLKDAARL